MSSTSHASVRITFELFHRLERVLNKGETVDELVEQALRDEVDRRAIEDAFRRRGLKGIARVEAGGSYHSAEEVIAKLEAKLLQAKDNLAKR